MEGSSIPKQLEDAVECINTGRSIEHYLEDLNLSRFDLEKCDLILDIGSGIEQRFARDCKKMGINTTVISLDPGIVFPEKNDLMYLTSKDEIARRRSARNKPARGTISAISQHLPFKDNSFDMILSLYSVPLYLYRKEDVDLTLAEMLRVLKKGGEARIYPVTKGFRSKVVDEFILKHEEVIFEKIQGETDPDSYLLVFTKINQLAS